MTKKQFNDFIEKFDFIHLFNHLGWDLINHATPIKINDEGFEIQSVAAKSGFRVLVCSPDSLGNIPAYPLRLKIDNAVSKLFKEHLLIFENDKKTQQVWQTNVKHAHQPSKLSSISWYKGQTPELLFQKAAGLIFTLDEEENITIVDVVGRVTANFGQNNERVTKQFYEKFKKEHTSFINFIKGIDDKLNRDWYASLMLNRLMFCYFIQKKGFLDNNQHYLREKLKHCQEKKGANQFYSFYRDFLLLLFHSGLGSPDHGKDLLNEIGNIPYLNGGLFDEHELEVNYKEIDIDDKAFERIFDFFDEWNWHLDTRATATGKDINPDVIGYIFEKYINDRADMGAYYTKEDITEYISKNSILPYLFDETKRQYHSDGSIWEMVKTSSDRYIYDAVKKGTEIPLPDEISIGLTNIAARLDWNKPATEEFALPSEIWREVVERRNRFAEVKNKLEDGEITQINDFITYNLDIRQFAHDVIQSCTDADFLKHFYKALNSVTILDPTCGSGAFLFAAMNILEPLYESCLTRMRNFTDDEDRLNKEKKSIFVDKYKYFRQVLAETQNEQHPNLQYYIYKSIILRNLYGVDIMKEAVEIAKLRLFLKLVATVDVDHQKPNMGLEPLPDIDFNIRSGNTLIGFGTGAELKKGLEYTFDGVTAKPIIEEKCDIIAKVFARYKMIQLGDGEDFNTFKKAKETLLIRLRELNHELNVLLHKQFSAIEYETWLSVYRPFHWFAEFYEIISENKGFDVIIGNPPYVELKIAEKLYHINNTEIKIGGNLHSLVAARCLYLISEKRYLGFIVPVAISNTERMRELRRRIVSNGSVWVSNYAIRPGKLFSGAEQRLSIYIHKKDNKQIGKIYTSKYLKWNKLERDLLFETLALTSSTVKAGDIWRKIPNEIVSSILCKVQNSSEQVALYATGNKNVFYKNTGIGYFVTTTLTPPNCFINEFKTSSSRETTIGFVRDFEKHVFHCLFSSSLYFLFYHAYSNCRDLNPSDLTNFRFPKSILSDQTLIELSNDLQESLEKNSWFQTRNQVQTGNVKIQSFTSSLSKPVIDLIDDVLAKHYGFSDEELDYIINYDIKYRMGKELESDEE